MRRSPTRLRPVRQVLRMAKTSPRGEKREPAAIGDLEEGAEEREVDHQEETGEREDALAATSKRSRTPNAKRTVVMTIVPVTASPRGRQVLRFLEADH